MEFYIKNRIIIIHFAFITVITAAGCKPQYLLFDNNVPEFTPKVFAKNVISGNSEYVGYCAFNPDGSEFYYAVSNSDWSTSKIIKISNRSLSRKDTLYLKDRHYEGEPFISRDGKTIYFMVVLPPAPGKIWQSNLYRAHKNSNGWGVPELLDSSINSFASEWHPTVTDNNIIYFTSERENGTSALHGDLFKAEIKDDRFINVIKLPPPINTAYNDSDPLIAPDESYLIFHSDRPGGFGEHDLYISFNKKGTWTNPINMGNNINTIEWEMAPSLTPDGKYLLFTRRKAIVTSEPAQIYWVSTAIFNNYK